MFMGDILLRILVFGSFCYWKCLSGLLKLANKVGAYAGQHCFVETFGNIVQIFQTKSALIPVLGDIVEEGCYQNVDIFYQKLQCMEIVPCLYLASVGTFGHNLGL